MYKLINNAKDIDDLSIDFDRSGNRRRDEITNKKKTKGKYHVRFTLKDVFGFQDQEKI